MEWLKDLAPYSSGIQAVSAVVSFLVTIVLVGVTLSYVRETKKYRVAAEKATNTSRDTLDELRNQHADHFGARVVATNMESYEFLTLMNLGPGPAFKVIAKVTYGAEDGRRYMQTGVTGLPVNQSITMRVTDVEVFSDIPDSELSEEDISIIVFAKSVLGQGMKRTINRLPRRY